MKMIALLQLLVLIGSVEANTGRYTRQTSGQPLPMPSVYWAGSEQMLLNPAVFTFSLASTSQSCDILTDAFKRYFALTFPAYGKAHYANRERFKRFSGKFDSHSGDSRVKGTAQKTMESLEMEKSTGKSLIELSTLKVFVQTGCNEKSYPNDQMKESYRLQVNARESTAELDAQEVWGALRGLETFSQLVFRDNELGRYAINETHIEDNPRFPFRGFMIDTSRHYLPVKNILEVIEALAENKMNVLHWHIVDDQSFPYQSAGFPELSRYGAFHPLTHIYTQADVMRVIQFARLRGVRVMPEWDTPGHTLSWGVFYKWLLTPCFMQSQSGQLVETGKYGPMNPTKNSTYEFMQDFLQEVTTLFHDPVVHTGGDEVNFDCWQSNPNITQFMKQMGFGNDSWKLQSFYTKKVLNYLINNLGKRPVVWQEVFFNIFNSTRAQLKDAKQEIDLDKRVIIDIWDGDYLQGLEQVLEA